MLLLFENANQEIRIIVGEKNDIPEKYLEQLFTLRQKHEEEIFPFPPPKVELYRKWWKIPTQSNLKRIWTIGINKQDKVIGFGNAVYNIKYDNLDRAHFVIFITKDQRRKGYGSLLLKKISENLPPQIEVTLSSGLEGSEGEFFLRNLKQEHSYEEILSMTNLSNFKLGKVRKEAKKLRQKAENNGYKFIFIEDAKYFDHLNYNEYLPVVENIWNEFPREDMSYEDVVLTPERYQEIYDLNAMKGDKNLAYVVVYKETNKPIGFTTSNLNEFQPWIIWQDDTGITQTHRGKGLGLAIKYQMLEKILQETDAKYWFTGNASSNVHMIRINKELKYKKWKSEFVFEFSREDLSKRLS